MKKTFRKLAAIILCAALMLAALPSAAFAADEMPAADAELLSDTLTQEQDGENNGLENIQPETEDFDILAIPYAVITGGYFAFFIAFILLAGAVISPFALLINGVEWLLS